MKYLRVVCYDTPMKKARKWNKLRLGSICLAQMVTGDTCDAYWHHVLRPRHL